MAKRAKAKAKREARESKKNKVEAQNIALTQQDTQKKKDRPSARKEIKVRKSVSPRAPRKKTTVKKSKKVVSDSSDGSSSEDVSDEIPMYDQRAILNKPSLSPSLVKVLPSPRKSPRSLFKPATKRKLQSEGIADASAKKARSNVPASTEEQKYAFKFLVDVIDNAAYDVKSNDISSLGLPDDVAKIVTKQFIELRKISKKLNQGQASSQENEERCQH